MYEELKEKYYQNFIDYSIASMQTNFTAPALTEGFSQ